MFPFAYVILAVYYCVRFVSSADLELLMTRAGDLVEFRIDAVLKDMAKTCLCELPGDEPWTVEHFLDTTQVRVRVCAR